MEYLAWTISYLGALNIPPQDECSTRSARSCFASCAITVLQTQLLQIHSPQRLHFHACVALVKLRNRLSRGDSSTSLTPSISRTLEREVISLSSICLRHIEHAIMSPSVKSSDPKRSLFCQLFIRSKRSWHWRDAGRHSRRSSHALATRTPGWH